MILNLVNQKRSDIPYKIGKFPDSQEMLYLLEPKRVFMEDTVTIYSRMSWSDVQIIIQAVNILKELKVQEIILKVPYFLGARSDRRFTKGSVNYMKEVMAPLINSLGVEVMVCDPHSIVTETLLKDVVTYSVMGNLVYTTMQKFESSPMKFHLVSPDEGAIKRTEAVVPELAKAPVSIVKCLKHRDPQSGQVMGVEVLNGDLGGIPCIVTDDICDGGATFLALAKELKAKNAGTLHLCVTHGIFSKGFDKLLEDYSSITTTNSYRDFDFEEGSVEKQKVYIYDVFR